MDFPTFVYRCPGPHFGPPGTTYGTLDVAGEDALQEALADGWHVSLLEAAEAFLRKPEPVLEVEPEQAADAPPTRDEMLEQARRIGLKVDRRWNDETLLSAIVAKMKEQNP
jgi:hypothetical protein